MPTIKFDGIVDKSSEDSSRQLFANNLLKTKDFKSWKCKQWEESAFVILELKQPQKVDSIEIGNDCSAFIEVLVANSTEPKLRFQVLLSTSSFMTPSDSKSKNNCNRIREFPKDKLSPNSRTEKWDRIKIVCKQPFNREISYGLAFIRFNTIGDNEDEMDAIPTKTNFGPFRLRSADNEDNEDNDSEPNSGAFFARRNNFSTDSSNDTKRTSLVSAVGLTHDSPKTPKTKPYSSDSSVKSKPNVSEINRTPNTLPKVSNSQSVAGGSANYQPLGPSPPKRFRNVTQNKPFNQLMSGVVFTLSGFVNPKRSDIRDEAIKMGAKYRPDWDQSCTHLICAFANTPKFNEVKSKKGRIVTENWIHDSYNQKKLMTWKRYVLGQTDDDDDDEDNDDNQMEDDEDYVPPVLDNRKRIQYIDDEEEEELSQMKEVIGFSSKNSPNETKDDMNDEIYDMETDESSGADNNTNANNNVNQSVDESASTGSQAIDIFKGRCFCLWGTFDDNEKQLLTDYIISHNGKLEESLSDNVKYVITNSEWTEHFEQACLTNESLIFVKPKWILKCHQNSKLIPFQPFIVSSNYE